MAEVEEKLVGGKPFIYYDNVRCSICGKEKLGGVNCAGFKARICPEHCTDRGDGQPCFYYIAVLQHCRYLDEQKVRLEQQKKVRRSTAGPSHR